MNLSQTKKIYFLNDTSMYHGGSWAVMDYLTNILQVQGYDIVFEKNKYDIEIEILLECDIVILNGEGTLHDSKPRAIHLLKVLDYAQKNGKETILCNTSWFNMSNEFDHILSKL